MSLYSQLCPAFLHLAQIGEVSSHYRGDRDLSAGENHLLDRDFLVVMSKDIIFRRTQDRGEGIEPTNNDDNAKIGVLQWSHFDLSRFTRFVA